MITIGSNIVDAALEGNRLAVRGFKGPFDRVVVNGTPRRVIKVTPSLYVPDVIVLTLEA